MRSVIVFFLLVQSSLLFAQAFEDVNTIGMISAKPAAATHSDFTIIKMNQATSVKNQSRTGTCWSFSTVSLVESQTIKNNLVALDLSEMFIVRNIYVEKAKNYILRQGHAQFSEGGLGHDVISAISVYGAVPESVYPGLKKQATHDHTILFKSLKKYLDSTLKRRQNLPINNDWLPCFNNILDEYLGEIPRQFTYNGQKYTPQSFAKEVLKFNPDDYINITSFTHHPYYTPCIIEVPDNFSNGSYYNLPLKEMIGVVRLNSGQGF